MENRIAARHHQEDEAMSTSNSNLVTRFASHWLFGAALAVTLMGCGAGSKVVTNVAFTDEVQSGDLYVGIDATLAKGSIVLPAAKLPLYNPKNPSQVLGELETNGLHILARVNASEALSLPDLGDGTKLPNGAPIPLVLPNGLRPVAIPVFNSNSIVYVAVNGNQILLGVAVSILKEDGLNLPLDLFVPFTISPQIGGTAGFFLGEKQGVAVFALKDSAVTPTAPTAPTPTATGVKTLAKATASRALPAMTAKIEVRNDEITSSTLRKFERARDRMRHVRLD
jgi:hypothetical protein